MTLTTILGSHSKMSIIALYSKAWRNEYQNRKYYIKAPRIDHNRQFDCFVSPVSNLTFCSIFLTYLRPYWSCELYRRRHTFIRKHIQQLPNYETSFLAILLEPCQFVFKLNAIPVLNGQTTCTLHFAPEILFAYAVFTNRRITRIRLYGPIQISC